MRLQLSKEIWVSCVIAVKDSGSILNEEQLTRSSWLRQQRPDRLSGIEHKPSQPARFSVVSDDRLPRAPGRLLSKLHLQEVEAWKVGNLLSLRWSRAVNSRCIRSVCIPASSKNDLDIRPELVLCFPLKNRFSSDTEQALA